VAVDVRSASPWRGKWTGIELDATEMKQLWIPPGFAHGFLVLSDSADVLYKTTEFRVPEFERTLAWNDPDLAIRWPLERLRTEPRLSARDAQAGPWSNAAAVEMAPQR
jgi:dTDP-4-dehydrorhamnose 3,5-epimerase